MNQHFHCECVCYCFVCSRVESTQVSREWERKNESRISTCILRVPSINLKWLLVNHQHDSTDKDNHWRGDNLYSITDTKVLMCELVIMKMYTLILDALMRSEVLRETHHFLDVFFSYKVRHTHTEKETDTFSEKYKCWTRMKKKNKTPSDKCYTRKDLSIDVALFFLFSSLSFCWFVFLSCSLHLPVLFPVDRVNL